MVMNDSSSGILDDDYGRYLTLKNQIFQNYFAAVSIDNEYYNLDYTNQIQIIPTEW